MGQAARNIKKRVGIGQIFSYPTRLAIGGLSRELHYVCAQMAQIRMWHDFNHDDSVAAMSAFGQKTTPMIRD
jgi:hypothetical protein